MSSSLQRFRALQNKRLKLSHQSEDQPTSASSSTMSRSSTPSITEDDLEVDLSMSSSNGMLDPQLDDVESQSLLSLSNLNRSRQMAIDICQEFPLTVSQSELLTGRFCRLDQVGRDMVLMAQMYTVENALADNGAAKRLESQEFKNLLKPCLAAVVLSAVTPYYTRGVLRLLLAYFKTNISVLKLPTEFKTNSHLWRLFEKKVSEHLSNFKSDVEKRIRDAIKGEYDIYELVELTLSKFNLAITQAHWVRFAFLRTQFAEFDIDSKATGCTSAWAHCDKVMDDIRKEAKEGGSSEAQQQESLSDFFRDQYAQDVRRYPIPRSHTKPAPTAGHMTKEQRDLNNAIASWKPSLDEAEKSPSDEPEKEVDDDSP